jgi:hypothetical protein
MTRSEHPRDSSKLRRASLTGMLAVGISLCLATVPARSEASILPPNDLWREDQVGVISALSEQQFNSVLTLIELRYRPIFFFFNAHLVINRFWTDGTVNAFAHRNGQDWIVDMFGGLARRREITPDGFALVACHEIGHHLAGYPFYTQAGNEWAATEGQSDTYAVQACARFIWRSDPANAQIAQNAPQSIRDQCAVAWGNPVQGADRDLCARIALASKSVADLFGSLEGSSVNYGTPDPRVVGQTVQSHPPAQCRLDTYLQAGLCGVFYNFDIIPGLGNPSGQNSASSEITAAATSCFPVSARLGTPGYNGHDRPRCWFAPLAR